MLCSSLLKNATFEVAVLFIDGRAYGNAINQTKE